MFFKKKCPNCGVMNPKQNLTCYSCGASLHLGQSDGLRGSGRTKRQLTEMLPETEAKLGTKQAASIQPVEYLSNRIGRIDLSQGSLVIELPGAFTRAFKKGSKPPLTRKILLSTVMDNQRIMEVRFSFELTKDHSVKPLARLLLTRIDPAPKGVPQIEVNISVDHGGEVSVSAMDKRTARLIEHEIYSEGSEYTWF